MRQSPLMEFHRRHGARFTEFAGWQMPLSFGGTAAEHRAVREDAGIFDLCHMGRLAVAGPDALALLERVTPSDIAVLVQGACRYTVVLNADGGIVDDVIVTRTGESAFHLCVNAASRVRVWNHLIAHGEGLRVRVTDESDAIGQIAVQGPATLAALEGILDKPLPPYMYAISGGWQGREVTVSRTGYSGELGVELFTPVAVLEGLWEHLFRRAVPCGLGARDTLRLEMGYPLYGHELSVMVTPVAAGLSWLVAWDREGFLGRERLLAERREPAQVLAGFIVEGAGIPREGCRIRAAGRIVGELTSGNMGLSVGRGIGLGYLPPAYAVPGTPVEIEVRGRLLAAKVAMPPFYRTGSLKRKVT